MDSQRHSILHYFRHRVVGDLSVDLPRARTTTTTVTNSPSPPSHGRRVSTGRPDNDSRCASRGVVYLFAFTNLTPLERFGSRRSSVIRRAARQH